MKLLKRVIARFRKMRTSVEIEPQRSVPPPSGSGASVNLTAEQFRQLMIAALEDSPRARAIVRQAFLPNFPAAGGMSCSAIGSTSGLTSGKLPYCDNTSTCDLADSNVSYDATNSRIGIGTASPQKDLHVSGASPVFLLRSTGTGLRGLWVTVDDTNQVIYLNSSFHDTGAYPITFQFAGSEKVRIDTSGNVGIGTSSPAAKLDVTGGINASGSVVIGGTATKQSSGGPELISAQNSAANKVVLATWDTSDPAGNAARLLVDIQGNHEWAGPPDANNNPDPDQSILMGFNQVGVLGLQGDPQNGGGMNVAAWKHSNLTVAADSSDLSFTVADASQFTTGAYARVDEEIVLIGTPAPPHTLPVTRGQQGTTAANHSLGAYVTQSGTSEPFARVSIQTARSVNNVDAGCQIGLGTGAAAADTFITRLAAGGIAVNKAMAAAKNVVTFSTTPTFDASLGNTQVITLTANVTGSTLSNAVAGQWLVFDIIQDATGGRTFVWPTNVKGAGTINGTANQHQVQMFYYDGTNAYAVGPMQTTS
jgi:hypothetical protein